MTVQLNNDSWWTSRKCNYLLKAGFCLILNIFAEGVAMGTVTDEVLHAETGAPRWGNYSIWSIENIGSIIISCQTCWSLIFVKSRCMHWNIFFGFKFLSSQGAPPRTPLSCYWERDCRLVDRSCWSCRGNDCWRLMSENECDDGWWMTNFCWWQMLNQQNLKPNTDFVWPRNATQI